MKIKIKPYMILIVIIVLVIGGIIYFLSGDRYMSVLNFHHEAPLQNGDIIFHTSTSSQSKAIQLATNSPYSHMGIIYIKDNKPYVFEAVQPVKLTPFNTWIKRGQNASYVIKRVKNADELLTPDVKDKMKAAAEKYIGKDFDLYFEWSDDRIYCSELVWKIYKEAADIEIGKTEPLSNFDLSNEIVKQQMKERYGNKIPVNKQVISPVSMFNSDKLITVENNY